MSIFVAQDIIFRERPAAVTKQVQMSHCLPSPRAVQPWNQIKRRFGRAAAAAAAAATALLHFPEYYGHCCGGLRWRLFPLSTAAGQFRTGLTTIPIKKTTGAGFFRHC